MKSFTGIPRAVVVLGVVSLLTDLGTEMIYPLLPLFFSQELGMGVMALGAIEGAAESLSSLLKILSGVWTDRRGKRKPFVVVGYTLSGAVRPLMGLATNPLMVLMIRIADRIGKGVRTSPRDALIADVTHRDHRGRAYGFHRAMDHAGAVIGPLIAAGLLGLGVPLRHVFLSTAIPGALVILLLMFAVEEVPATRGVPSGDRDPCGTRSTGCATRLSSSKSGGADPALPHEGAGGWDWSKWRAWGPSYRRFLLALFVFSLGNASDMFLLMRLNDVGVPAGWIVLLWSCLHVVKSSATAWGGRWVDRWGPRRVLLMGWTVYAVCDFGFGWTDHTAGLIALFLGYGIFFGLTEPSERAWVSLLVPPALRGTAFGGYHGVAGLSAFPASFLFGVMWMWGGPRLAFSVSSALAVIACLMLMRMKPGSPLFYPTPLAAK